MGLLFNSQVAIDPDYMRKKRKTEKEAGKALSNEEFERDYLTRGGQSLE